MRQAVWFTVQKTELLKTLSALEAEGGAFRHGFRLNVRMGNILERFNRIRRKLDSNPAIVAVR